MVESYLAIDVGGTKILVGEVSDAGLVLQQKRYESVNGTQAEIFSRIQEVITDYISTATWAAGYPGKMGVGLIGRVNPANGIWLQIDGKRNTHLPVAQKLSEIFQMPCYIDNDVKAATRAEQMWGYGNQSSNFIYINVGTGIAAGTVTNGQLIRGSHFNAGEVGHTSSGLSLGINCPCGRKDCTELVAAGLGFDYCARLLAPQYSTNLVIPALQSGKVNVEEVYALYQEGDALCILLVENAAAALANLIMNMVRMSDPDTVVLGGSIMSTGLMLSKIKEKLSSHTIRFVTNGVVETQLDPKLIGLLGAGAVAKQII